MFRQFAKKALRKIAIRTLNMEFDVEERQEQSDEKPPFDPTKIPKVVDGSGDTPGPNHKTDIGRTWLSAQLSGGVQPFLIDIRPPNEVVSGIIPSAHLLPGQTIFSKMDLLPEDKSLRIVVYDQTDALGSEAVATALREQGWTMTRRLVGGFAEWIEWNEETRPISKIQDSSVQIGDNIILPDNRRAYVFSTSGKAELWNKKDGYLGSYADIFSS